MKVKVIRTFDKGMFEKELMEIYNSHNVKEVQTHTESQDMLGHFLIHYVAIVFYYEVPEGLIKDLGFTNRTYNALRRYGIETIEDLERVMCNGDIKRIRNLGKVSLEEIERKLNTI